MILGFDRIADPAFVADLSGQPLSEVRRRRDDCQVLENSVSYVRRVAHGRLDIAGTELASRSAGADSAELQDLVERLPGTLADSGHSTGLPQRAAQALEPPEDVVAPIMAELDGIIGPGELSSLPGLDTERLAAAVALVQAFESEISQQRHKLHDVIDILQAEIGRRYQSGEVSVDSLLN
jgi:hypothetical protein